MTPTTAHRVVVGFVLAVLSVFYLLSPTVYAYFSEVGVTYMHAPKWFATTAPASATDATSHTDRATKKNRSCLMVPRVYFS